MITVKVTFIAGDETLVGTTFLNNQDEKISFIFLHGAGEASKEKLYPVAQRLLNAHIPSFCFDFSGHGESTGELHNSSL